MNRRFVKITGAVLAVALSVLAIGSYFLSRSSQSYPCRLEAEQKTYPKGTASINCVLVNQTDTILKYWVGYSLERYEQGEWVSVKENGPVIFDYIGDKAGAREERLITYQLIGFSTMQKSGKYRIVQEVDVGDKEITVYAMFQIE